MSNGLSINDVVNVTVSLTAIASAVRNFGALLIVSATTQIDTTERIRSYTSLAAVGADLGQSDGAYLAAKNVFAQTPTPALVKVGRWAQAATFASLKGGLLSASEQGIASWNAITTGGMLITIDGTVKTLGSLTFAAAANMPAVAAIISTALSTSGSCIWNAVYNRFEIVSATTGASSTLTYASAPGSGVDVSAKLRLTAASGSNAPVQGIVAETYLAAVTALAAISTDWYGLTPGTVLPVNADHVAVAGFIEAAAPSRIYGITSQESGALSAASTADLPYLLNAGSFGRSFAQYSSFDPYAVASMFGRAFTVDFNGQNTTLTLKFKVEPGVGAETLSETQASVLATKKCNVFVNYNNSTAIIQEGTMANGYFFDEVQGLDWLQNRIQTDVYNLLYNSATKIPQTDAGVNQIVNTVSGSCDAANDNGLVAPGVWSGAPLGAIKTGQTLTKGYYVYANTIASQSSADRAARKAPLCQVIAKLAGAIHFANVQVNVVR